MLAGRRRRPRCSSELRGERRAIAVRLAGEERWIDAADAGLYRDALGVVPPGGLPAAFLEDVPDALARAAAPLRARRTGRSRPASCAPATASTASAALSELERAGELVRGELRPGGTEREWCHPEVLRRLRRASLAVLRKEIEPADQRALARFLPGWQGVDRHPRGRRRRRPPARGARAAAGPRAPGGGLGARRPAAPRRRLLAVVDGPAVRERRGRVDRRRRARAQLGPRGAVLPRGPAACSGRRRSRAPRRTPSPRTRRCARGCAAGACFFTDLLVDVELAPEELQEALWDLVWAGEATNDAFAPLRAPRLTLARAQRDAEPRGAGDRAGAVRGAPARRAGRRAQVQGRWSLTAPLFRAVEVDPAARRRALGELLLERYGILTREQVLAEGDAGRLLRDLLRALAARDARGRPARLLRRGAGRRAVRAAGCGRAAARAARDRDRAAGRAGGGRPRPAVRRGAAVAGARRRSRAGGRHGVGRAPTWCCAAASRSCTSSAAAAHCRRSSRRRRADRSRRWRRSSSTSSAARSSGSRSRRSMASRRSASPLGPELIALGFQEGPRRLTLSA